MSTWGRSKWRSPSHDETTRRIGREPDVEDYGQLVGRDKELGRRQVHTVVRTVLNVVIQDPSGNVLGRTILPFVPTGDAVINFPFGPVTLDAPVPTLDASAPGLTALPQPLPVSPLSINVPGTTAQSVLSSSPPPTPNASPVTSPPAIATIPSITPSYTISNSSSTPLITSPTSGSLNLNSTTVSGSRTSSQVSQTLSTSSLSSTTFPGIVVSTSRGGASPSSTPPQTTPAISSDESSDGTPVYVPVVGGVVGGLAGLALILALILFFLRWRKRQMKGARQLSSGADGEIEPTEPRPDAGGPMTQRASSWGAAGLVVKKMRPYSEGTTTTETAPSERGFQKISGRKLESVLLSGGDGYGGSGPSQQRTERYTSGSTWYRERDSQGTSLAVGPASAQPSVVASSNYDAASSPPGMLDRGLSASPPDTSSPSPPPDAVIMRPGPARQPVHEPGFGNTRADPTLPPGLSPLPPRIRQDGIGRSHPSLDGSRDSRGSRFAEDFT